MIKQESNCLFSPIMIDVHSSVESTKGKNESIQDKLCYSTSGDSIEELLISDEEEFFLEIAKNQHKIINYKSQNDIAYSSRSNILTWSTKLLNAVTLTNKQKQSIFHRFSSAYDLINENLFIDNKPIEKDKPFKRTIVALFLIVYKLEGYTVGKITIKSLIDAFLADMNIKEADIKRSELAILKLFNYNCSSFEDNLHNLSLSLIEMIKKKYNLSSELSCMIRNKLDKMNRIIQFSDKVVFNINPIDKAAISIFALVIFLKKTFQKDDNELYTYQLIYSEMALLIYNLYFYLKTVLKVITIPQSDFNHYSSIYSEMM